ncbi:XRE family transcriptional regulator [Dactylosporangium sp. NPDC049140]|uniref:XRE family transcriptional regulator n=1 Tax=Dactylosporangium sp. NPDC049140 TaxID=3155647 RepID=UPI0033F3F38D
MANERLRDAMLRNGLVPATIAESLGVDPKTVERWITQDRIPYPKHRHAIAALVKESATYLWPNAVSGERAAEVSKSEVVQIYPRRGAVPADLWQRLLDQATGQIGLLAYAGLFLPEQNPRWVETLRLKAAGGAKVEILLGDPASSHVAQRGADEGIGGAMASKVHNVLAFYKELRGEDNAAIYFHDTTLYNSIYRFDDEMLVNTHLYGTPAAYAPVLHLRRLPGGEIFDNYVASFNRVLSHAQAVWPED